MENDKTKVDKNNNNNKTTTLAEQRAHFSNNLITRITTDYAKQK